MLNNHITLSRDTIFEILFLEKTLLERIGAIEKAFSNVDLDELILSFIDTALDCMGTPQDLVIDSDDINNPEEVYYSREDIEDIFRRLKPTERSIKEFLNILRKLILEYYRQNPAETIFTLDREHALAQILLEHCKWTYSINKLKNVGIEITWADSVNPLQIVFKELGKEYVSIQESRFDEFIKMGTLQEAISYVRWLKDNA